MVTPTEPMSVTGQEAGLLTAISPQEPCGVSIDEDPQFLLLTSGLQPRTDAQYGDFYEPAESINWTDVEVTTRKLLQKPRYPVSHYSDSLPDTHCRSTGVGDRPKFITGNADAVARGSTSAADG